MWHALRLNQEAIFNSLRFSRRSKRLDGQLIPQHLHQFPRSESIDHLRQCNPIAEPLSLRISSDRQRLEKHRKDVCARYEQHDVPLNRIPRASRPASIESDDHQAVDEFPDALPSDGVTQECIAGSGQEEQHRFSGRVKHGARHNQQAVKCCRGQPPGNVRLGVRRRKPSRPSRNCRKIQRGENARGGHERPEPAREHRRQF
jgi:hypothetical protein